MSNNEKRGNGTHGCGDASRRHGALGREGFGTSMGYTGHEEGEHGCSYGGGIHHEYNRGEERTRKHTHEYRATGHGCGRGGKHGYTKHGMKPNRDPHHESQETAEQEAYEEQTGNEAQHL